MRTNAHLVAGESRWLPVSIAIAALALTPSAAHASSKLFNAKSLADSKAMCPVAAQTISPAPMDMSRAILGGAPSALDRIRADQQGEPSAASGALAVFPANIKLEPASRGPIGVGGS